MRRHPNNRLLGIESLENRIVFADDLVMIEVPLLIQWNLLAPDSDIAIEFHDMQVPVSRERLAMIGQGGGFADSIYDVSTKSHGIDSTMETSLSIASSGDHTVRTTHAVSTASNHTNNSLSIHLATDIPTLKSSPRDTATDPLASPLSSNSGPFAVEPANAPLEEKSPRSLAPSSRSSEGFRAQFLEEVSKIQSPRTPVAPGDAASSNEATNSVGFDKPSDESLGLSGIRRQAGKSPSQWTTIESTSENRPGMQLLEFGSNEFFAESFVHASLPDESNATPAHRWSLLFGVAQSTSPFTVDMGNSDLAGVRGAILEVVAGSEQSDILSAEPPSTYSSNGWKATSSILAAAFVAVVYRKKRQQDLEYPQRSGLRRLR